MLITLSCSEPQDHIHGNNYGELQKIYDTWEFHENDVINARAKLRSIRAKLAILEGKMALSIMYGITYGHLANLYMTMLNLINVHHILTIQLAVNHKR